jgi:hypothetical protein
MKRSVARAALLLAAVLAWSGGCSSPPGADPDSVTRGLSLEMYAWGEGNFAVFYRVGTNGTLGFGGGVDARVRNVSWTGPLTTDEIDRLWVLLQEHGWFSGAVNDATEGDPKERQYRIKVRWPEGGKRYRIKGPNPEVAPVEMLLDTAARRRIDRFLETLPEPSRISGGGEEPGGP